MYNNKRRVCFIFIYIECVLYLYIYIFYFFLFEKVRVCLLDTTTQKIYESYYIMYDIT